MLDLLITNATLPDGRTDISVAVQAGAACFGAVTTNSAKAMGLKSHGLEAGCEASFVLLQAGTTERRRTVWIAKA